MSSWARLAGKQSAMRSRFEIRRERSAESVRKARAGVSSMIGRPMLVPGITIEQERKNLIQDGMSAKEANEAILKGMRIQL